MGRGWKQRRCVYLGLVDGNMVGNDPVLKAIESILEGDVVARADTNGRAVKVLPSNRCFQQGIIHKDKEA